jgi:hypothetical protein
VPVDQPAAPFVQLLAAAVIFFPGFRLRVRWTRATPTVQCKDADCLTHYIQRFFFLGIQQAETTDCIAYMIWQDTQGVSFGLKKQDMLNIKEKTNAQKS